MSADDSTTHPATGPRGRATPGPGTNARTNPAAVLTPLDRAIERASVELSRPQEHALAAAAQAGLVDPERVVAWTRRAERLLLFEWDRSALRSEVRVVAERLADLLDRLPQSAVDSEAAVSRFVLRLGALRALLAEDVEAAYQGDPAAASRAEIVVAYPCIRALSVHRLAHELYDLKVPLVPRIMAEYSHGQTGIDIHPGARIGRRCFIDHGTGVVIGETAEVGDGVRIYQGVTLGALSLRDGRAQCGAKRHPTIEDDVTIYAGAQILGGETVIGQGSVIGGNVWLTESVPPLSRVLAEPASLVVQRRAANESAERQLEWNL